jgi:hypothetical protein
MSLALFHEYQGTRQGVSAVVTGKFREDGMNSIVTIESRAISLYRLVSSDSDIESLRYAVRIIPSNVFI